MGRLRENARYNVVSTRLDDKTWNRLVKKLGQGSISDFVRMAVVEKLADAVSPDQTI